MIRLRVDSPRVLSVLLFGIVCTCLSLTALPASAQKPASPPPQTAGPVSVNGQGGPDSFGYVWKDSNEAGGPAYSWFDISSRGTDLTLGDDTALSVPLPFPFPFYGQSKSSVWVSANGFLSFGTNPSGSFSASDSGLPNASNPNDMIAVLWTDLLPVGGTTAVQTYYDAVGDRFIVQWKNIKFYYGSASALSTFQVQLHAGGAIEMMYQTIGNDPENTSATVGLENATGTTGLQVVHNTAYVQNGLAVYLAPWGNLNLTASDNLSDRVSLTWTDAAGEDSYRIFRDDELLTTVAANTTSYNDTGATRGVDHTYCVAAYVAGAPLFPVCDSGTMTLEPVASLTASDGTLSDRVTLAWPDVTGEIGFNIYRDNALIATVAANTTTYSDTGATFGTTHNYCVAAKASSGSESTRVCDTGRLGSIAPVPTFSAGDGTFTDRVALTWPDVAGEIAYNLFRNNSLLATVAANTTSYDDVTAQPGTTYNYCVSVKAGVGNESTRVCDAGHRGVLTASNDDFEDRVELEWPGASLAGSIVTITRKPPSSARIDLVLLAETVTSYVDRSGDPGVDYEYCIAITTKGVARTPVCATGGRKIFEPTKFLATKGTSEAGVLLTWSDRSTVEDGYVITRTGGLPPIVLPPNRSSYLDAAAVPGTTYTYTLQAYVRQGATEFRSLPRTADGWRGFVTPPALVEATDGQWTDRVRITWVDQSSNEDRYTVYRYTGSSATGTRTTLGSVPKNDDPKVLELQYDDLTAVANVGYWYCVTGTTGGQESVPVCDAGKRSGLAAPTEVVASDNLFDDRVKVTWRDMADTEDGFIVLRGATAATATPIDTTDANVETFTDYSAAQGTTYFYCVKAISRANPASPSKSTQLCDTGTRIPVLAPTNVLASDGDFEKWTTLTWTNPSTTASLFKIYRDGAFIRTVPATTLTIADEIIESDVVYDYCVGAVTLVGASSRVQEQVTQLLTSLESGESGVRSMAPDGVSNEAEHAQFLLSAVESSFTVTPRSAGPAGVQVAGMVESAPVCDLGNRSIGAPTGVSATFDDHEDRVEITWTDKSLIETGYRIVRDAGYGLTFEDHEARVTVPAAEAFNVRTAFTLEGWINLADGSSAIVVFQNNWESGTGFQFEVSPTGGINTFFNVDSDPFVVQAGGGSVQPGTWTHVAATWSSGQPLRLYVDGTMVAEGDPVTGTISISSDPVTLGDANPDWGSRAGRIDEVRMWDVARSADALKADMNRSLVGNESGLRAYWPMNEGSGTTTADKVHGNNGTFVGATRWVPGTPVGGGIEIGRISATRTSFGDYTGAPGDTYTYEVRAFDAYGESLPGTDTGRRTLEPPSGVSATDAESEAEVTVTWVDNSRAEKGYTVLREGTVVGTAPQNATTFHYEAKEWDAGYGGSLYSVRAFDDYGSSLALGDPGSAAIFAPGSVSASDTYTDRIVVTWINDSRRASRVRVYRDGVFLRERPFDDPTHVDRLSGGAVQPGVSYSYCVEAVSDWSSSERVCDTGRILPEPAPITANTITFAEIIAANDASADSQFGFDVSVDGEYAVVGAGWDDQAGENAGAAYVFKYDGTQWVQFQKLTAADGAAGDRFGTSVAISGEFLVVGAVGDDQHRGSAYVFKRSGSQWDQISKLVASTQEVNGYFGWSAAIDGDFIVVGSIFDGNEGAAYVFKRTGTTVTLWQKLSNGVAGAGFGWGVSISGEYMLIGAPNAGSAANFYRLVNGSWVLQTATTPAGLRDYFGRSVDIDGRHAIVSNHPNGKPRDGLVHIYVNNGTTWVEESTLTSDGSLDERRAFGKDVAIRDGRAVIGTSLDATAVMYEEVDGVWSKTATFRRPDAQSSTYIDLSNDNLIIGAPSYTDSRGAAFLLPILAEPSAVAASDGTFSDRIQVRWTDESLRETEYRIYRRDATGSLNVIASVDANKTNYDDLSAPPGSAFEYCVVAFNKDLSDNGAQVLAESGRVCDFGWLPANGSISGRISASGGGGTRDVNICLLPNPNQGLLMDGIAGYLTLPYVAPPDEMTVCAWVKPVDQRRQVIMGWGNSAGTDNKTQFRLTDLGKISYSEWNGSENPVTSTASVTSNEWQQVCMVKTASTVSFYLDGEPAGSGTYVPHAATTTTLHIGAIEQNGTMVQFFKGQLDEVQLWNDARSPEEIKATRKTSLLGDEQGLVGFWPLNEGARSVTADLTRSGRNGLLVGGAYWSTGAYDVCAISDVEGNYTLGRLPYDETTEFTVTPRLNDRSFAPAFKRITLSTQSPVQNEVGFTDKTAFSLAGRILFEGTTCPVPDISLFLSELTNGSVGDETLKGSTETDGTYSIAADPSIDDRDLRRIVPRFLNGQDAGDVHVFTPARQDLIVKGDRNGIDFIDTKTRLFTGFFGSSCGFDIGTATLLITTENGCFEKEVATRPDGSYSVALPPQKYLVQVKDVVSPLRAAILTYFDGVGAQPIDLTLAPDTLDLIYHAPLDISVTGMPAVAPSCPTYTKLDEDGQLQRTLGAVPLLNMGDPLALTVTVNENYGVINGVQRECVATSGTLTIYDGIAEVPKVEFDLKNGPIEYETTVGLPNVFAGARVDGIDRSFQKSLSAVAEVPGREAATQTEWVIVQGARPRTGTFVTVPSEPIPMFALHDPPGDNSYAYIEKGSTMCKGMSYEEAFLVSLESEIKTKVGFQFITGTSFGGFFALINEYGGGPVFEISGGVGGVFEHGYSVCMTTTENFATSSDPAFVGPDADVLVGLGLNFTFSEADRVTVDACVITVDDALGVGIDTDNPIATTYHFTRGLLRDTMIPQLAENAARETGAAKTEQENAVKRWQQLLAYDAALADGDAFHVVENQSFSAGADVEKSTSFNRSDWDNKGIQEELRFSAGTDFGGGSGGNKTEVSLKLVTASEAKQVFTGGEESEFTIGYVLADDDPGDFFTVDVGQSNCSLTERSRDDFKVKCDAPLETSQYTKPPFAPGGELLFKLRSGTSSNPWEDGTQKRDLALLSINPPVRKNIAPDKPATFTLTLTNAGESQEARDYVLQTDHTSNPGGAVLMAQGSPIHNGITFTLGAQQSQEVTLSVERGPTVYTYNGLKVDLFPPDDDQDAVRASVSFDVAYDAPCSDISIQRPMTAWRLNKAAIAAGGLDVILNGFRLPVSEIDTVATLGLQYRLAGAGSATGNPWLPAAGMSVGVKGVTGGSPNGLDIGATSWPASGNKYWTPPGDGEYELRAYTECVVSKAAGRVYSMPVSGIVDTKAPQVLGTPEPGDRVLALGDDISITFDEPLACSSITTQGANANTKLTYGDGAGSGTRIPITSVCEGRTAVLDLDPAGTVSWPSLEGRLLRVDIGTGVTDAVGNPLPEALHWTFTVRRSEVAWSPSALVATVPYRALVNFTADVVNGRAESAGFTLSSSWIPLSPDSGTLEPSGKSSISFTFDGRDGSKEPGEVYLDVIHAAVTVGEETLDIELPVEITVADFEQQAIALQKGWTWFSTNRVPTTSLPDTVLASLPAHGGDLIKSQTAFSLFDASSGGWVGALTSVVNGQAYHIKLGEAATLFVEGDEVDPTIPITVRAGWNWLGFLPQVPIGLADALGSLPKTGPIGAPAYSGDVIKSQFAFAQYSGGRWNGSLTQLEPGVGYMLRSKNGGTLIYPVGPPPSRIAGQNDADSPIAVDANMGHGVDPYVGSTAAIDAGSSAGSLVMTAVGLTVAMDESGLATDPGLEGSPYRTLEDLVVPTIVPLDRKTASAVNTIEGEVLGEAVALRERAGLFDYSMTLTGALTLDDVPMTGTDVMLRASVDGELRGAARPQFVDGEEAYRVFLMIYGAEGDEVTFDAYDAASDESFPLEMTLAFENDGSMGTVSAPISLAAETDAYRASKLAAEIPDAFELTQNYPNPFNPETTIRFGLPEATQVTLEVFDVIGRRVAMLLDRNERQPGWYEIPFDARHLASGSYFYRISTPVGSLVKRMVVLK